MMTVLSAQTITNLVQQERLGITPFQEHTRQYKGLSYGVTAAGYDIRVGKIRHPRRDNVLVEALHVLPGEFVLASSLERMTIPDFLQVTVHDKSTWARQGLAAQTTVLEPGWEGHITLELSNHGNKSIHLMTGMPIAQLVFHQLDKPTLIPYSGKYQNQDDTPTFAKEMPDD